MQQLSIGTLLQGGKYKIEKVLGQGGFGITYLAEHTILDKKVAIKEFFPKDFCDRNETTSHITLGTSRSSELVAKLKLKFIKEAKNIAKLNHPNIVSIQDIFEENNTAYYLMSHIEGESLGDKLKRKGAISEQESLEYIRQIAGAIEYMHSLSMNHLDIKPSNIMIRDIDNMPMLIDFGTSKQYDNDGEQTSTMAPSFTHGYAPIEQYKPGGVSSFTPQTDIYALGATLFASLTGNKPPHYSEILEGGLPELPSNVSKSTREGIEHAMEIRKNKRPESIAEFLKHFNFQSYNNVIVSSQDKQLKQVPAKQEQHTESFEEEATIYLQDASMLKFTSNIISEDKSRHINGIEYIDLGLSVLWANRNFGAKYPYETGIYVDKEDDATTSKICEWNFNGSMIPTIAQFEELRTKCSWIRARQKNIEGFAVRGRNGKEIFVPYSKSAMGLSINTYGNFFTKESFYKDSYINYYMYYGTSGYKLTKYASKLICPIRLVAPKN